MAASHPFSELAVGDPVRSAIGRAVIGSMLAAAVFVVFIWAAKGLPWLYLQEPWQDDPYDAVVSFALTGVPLLIVPAALRVRLCRRYAPLPARRAVDLLRISRVLVAAMAVTLGSEWVSVILHTQSRTWTAMTAALIGALAVMTGVTLVAGWQVRRAGRAARRRGEAPPEPDWLADAITLGERDAAHLGPWRDAVVTVVHWLDRQAVVRVRRHPLAAAAVFSVLFAAVVDSPQIVIERYAPGLGLWFMGVTASTTFAFLVVAGGYLRVIGQAGARPAPVVHALVAACACVPVTAAFRGSLWWLTGATGRSAGLAQVTVLTLVVPAAVGTLVFACELLIWALRR